MLDVDMKVKKICDGCGYSVSVWNSSMGMCREIEETRTDSEFPGCFHTEYEGNNTFRSGNGPINYNLCPPCNRKIIKLLEAMKMAQDPLGNLVKEGYDAHKIMERVRLVESWIEEDNPKEENNG